MCVFCAAIPTAASLGAYANSKQKERVRKAAEQGKPAPRMIIPAGRVTAGAIVALVICSVVYHTQVRVPYL